ncbi:MAG: 23S rRNA (uracil(1939)-C(5))-methyltransferase RlmD [Myxococcota bacterium]|nr:23S rRNA (uracil(1939)-C(5))-methyltransferase RlmD [Myxococcota bacterium]
MNNLLTGTVEKWVYGGRGLIRWQGKAVFVSGAVPGDEAEFRIIRDHGRYADAELVRIITPSSRRLPAPCPRFGVCGGCQFQNADYSLQLEMKRLFVAENLRRIAPGAPVAAVIPSPLQYGYRLRAKFHVERSAGKTDLGFLGASSNRIIPLDACVLLREPLFAGVRRWIDAFPDFRGAGELHAALGLDAPGGSPVVDLALIPGGNLHRPRFARISGETILPHPGDLRLYHAEDGMVWAFHVFAFMQNNAPAIPVLLGLVREWLEAAKPACLADLYCGAGLYGLLAARMGMDVISMDSSRQAIECAAESLRLNGVGESRWRLLAISAEEALRGGEILNADAMILNPPRAGCSREVLSALRRWKGGRLLYVSCDPARLARDTDRLGEAGLRLERAQPLDLFPQTTHVETLAFFTRA